MTNLYYHLLPPHNSIAEELLLGSIIINPDIFIRIFHSIKIEYFFIESHQIIYRNLIKIQYTDKINPINLIYSLKTTATLRQIGGITRIIELIKQSQNFSSSNNISFYIRELITTIHYNYIKRLIIQYGYNVIQLGYIAQLSNTQLYTKASQYLKYINNTMNLKNLDNLQDLIGYLMLNIKNKNREKISPNQLIFSGFKELDILTNGLPKGDLIVIAGRPSIGKTSFVINITYHILTYIHIGICIFSLEMTKIQILHKLISIGSHIPIHDIVSGKINIHQWYSIQSICNRLLRSKIYINDNSNITIDHIEYTSKLIAKKRHHPNVLIIDYLQLITAKDLNIENRTQELSYITRELKILAQTLNVPIIILSQLNRSIEKRINKKPLLSDLKESGCINYKLLTNLDNLNKLHIKQIKQYYEYINLQYCSGKFNITKKNKNYLKTICLLNQYTFLCKFYCFSNIATTDNHKFLTKTRWLNQYQLMENYIILKENIASVCTNRHEKIYIKQIIFYIYTFVYDIARINYLNFICNNIILHNSIEQDADIVMMLYRNDINLENSKLLDIIISKNRNGPIGSFQLFFDKKNTLFKNIQHTSVINILQ